MVAETKFQQQQQHSTQDDCHCRDGKFFHPTASSSSSSQRYHNFFHFKGAHLDPLNPGNISNLHAKVRNMMPHWIEGLSVRCAKNVDGNKAIYGEWLMGNQTPVGTRFGCAIATRTNDENVTRTPLLTCDTNPSSLASNFRFLYHPIPEIKVESKFQTLPFPKIACISNSLATVEYQEKQTTVSLNLYNPSLSEGKVTLGILHSFTKTFCGGVELLSSWHAANSRHFDEVSLALAGRYSVKSHSIAATVSKKAFDVSLWLQPRDHLQIGASLIVDSNMSKSVGALCYQMDFDDAKVKGMIDTDFSVGCTYTAFLKNLSSKFGFSLLFCIPTQKFYCGLKYENNSNFQ